MTDEPAAAHRRTRWAARVTDPRAWLSVYAVALALVAFWPVPVDSGARPFLRAVTALFPALTSARIEFVANIVMFVPLGFLLTVILRRRRWMVLPIAFLTTVVIETGQAVALAARTPSVLDIVANTAGACAGMLLAALAERLARARTRPPADAPAPPRRG
ncbi:VanZ family protein [Microbacterium hominis]|uniref:VanZ family protein n=1 Tax=Microbacterium TaxID=33882 RepID=UPI00168BFC63|nr:MULTISPECIES: VanZ family protein [Microbacterium]QOC26384.1 VanZ family protein [Microbacterium hominis]QOC30400.1 VanZ family protein [Microbacterium hominis]QYF97310.1 VanZ family protein [Microbacterium sp. PAMC21962]